MIEKLYIENELLLQEKELKIKNIENKKNIIRKTKKLVTIHIYDGITTYFTIFFFRI